MKKLMNWLKNEESGQGMVEYALIIALIAVVLIVALTTLKNGIENVFNETANKLDKAV